MEQTSIKEVDARTAEGWVRDGRAALVDVREPDEFAAERIAGARSAPLSRFEPARVLAEIGRGSGLGSANAEAGPAVVMYCKSGMRSREAAARLAGSGTANVYTLTGGIDGWKKAGLGVERVAKAPISIMRQVQITAGALVAIGTLLAATMSPWFLIVPGFIGTGLMVAGASGFCGMAAMLRVMPWNRAVR